MITLRHGNNNIVRNNIIIGKGEAGLVLSIGINDVSNLEKLDNNIKGKELNKQWTPKNIILKNRL